MVNARRAGIATPLFMIAALLISACSGGGAATSTPASSPTAVAPTPTASAAATPTLGATPTPFPTLTPTAPPSPTARATATAVPVPVPTPTSAPATATPVAIPSIAPIGELVPFNDEFFGFAIDYPKNWTAAEGDPSQRELLFIAQSELGVPRVLVDLLGTTKTNDLKGQAADALEQLKTVVQDIKIVSEGPTKLGDGTDAYGVNIVYKAGQIGLGTRLVVASKDGRTFQVLAQTVEGDFAGRLPDLERIIKSFRFTEPTPFGVTRKNALALAMSGPSTLDPQVISDAASYNYVVSIFSGLVGLDKNLNVVPELAESWDVLDGGKTYVFHLRKNAKFQDGRQVVAGDVKYSIERATSSALGSRTPRTYLNDIVGVTDKLAGLANNVTGVEVLDPATVRIRIKEPVPYFLAKLTYPVAFVLDQKNVETGDDWFVTPNGTGPFKLRGWNPGVVVVLERNDGFYRTPAKVPYILIWNFVTNSLAQYQANQLDVAPLGTDDLVTVQDPNSPLKSQLQISSQLTVDYIGFNSREAPFDDPRARRAFAMAVDIDSIVKDDLRGAVQRAAGIMPPGLPGYNASLQPIPYDAKQAKTLWDTVLAEKKITTKQVTMLVSGGQLTPSMVKIAKAWQDNLGVTMKFQTTTSGDLFKAVEQSKSQLFDFGWIADYPDPQNFLEILFYSQSANNAGYYRNAAFDKLLDQARIEQDSGKRVQLYREAEQLMMDDIAAVPLWFGKNYNLVRPEVKSWFLSAQNVPDLVGVTLDRTLPPLPTPTPTPPPTSTPAATSGPSRTPTPTPRPTGTFA